MAKLYELAREYRQLAEDLESMDGLSKDLVIDTLSGSTELMSLEEKVSTIVSMTKNWQGDIPAYKAEIKRLTDEMKAIENRIDNVKEYLKQCLITAGLDKIKIGTFTVSLQNNPPALVIHSADNIPAEFMTIIPEQYIPDKERVKKALKDGQVIEGVEITQGKSLRIR